ncbi:MAG TPA: hypothetical protein VK976_07345 [Verrucomicrobiae bacterium]|jgi:hypothetical protein|nr:hypothetical protein [Verrucomicrobiae bacterium]
MIDLKKKCWREKVTAEITVAHILHFANEMGASVNATEAAAFLNERGRAQAVWTHMMQAGEEFLKSKLAGTKGLHTANRSVARPGTPGNPLLRKGPGTTEAGSIVYQ